jgi:hypothetical protein
MPLADAASFCPAPAVYNLISPIGAVTEWAETHMPAIAQAQRHYDLSTS